MPARWKGPAMSPLRPAFAFEHRKWCANTDHRGRACIQAWRFEPIPGGYRVVDANDLVLAHVYGQPPSAIAFSDQRLTDDEAEKIARLIVRLPELVDKSHALEAMVDLKVRKPHLHLLAHLEADLWRPRNR